MPSNSTKKSINRMNSNLLLREQSVTHELLRPENALEYQMIELQDFATGLFWGEPRYGHPEGKIIYHIREVLDNVDALSLSPADRQTLRLITFVHDTFKYKEHKGTPRDWSRHHGMYARHFATQFTDDEGILDMIELHDEAYYCWQLEKLRQNKTAADNRLAYLFSRIGDNLQLYYLFFKCDTRTGDKVQAPVKWFEQTVRGIQVVSLGNAAAYN
jgi:HD domain